MLYLAAMCSGSMMWAQQVPDSISQRFRTDYPNATNPTWNWQGGDYSVNYQDEQSRQHNLFYDRNGEISRSQYEIGVEQVPFPLSDYYTKNYPDKTGYKIWIEEDKAGNKSYYIPQDNETLYFDNTGKFLRKTNNDDRKPKRNVKTNKK